MVVAQFVVVYLAAAEGKAAPESHDEVLHIMNDITLNDALVHILDRKSVV